MAITPKIRFDKSGYYFIGLIALVFLGFFPSYFYKFLKGNNHFPFYFHIHVLLMSFWIALLIIQPILIRKKKLDSHRYLGKFSYFLMPLLIASIFLVLNSNLKEFGPSKLTFQNVILPFRDIFILASAFIIAIWHRKDFNIHARAMVVTGIVFIEPALIRLMNSVIFRHMDPIGNYVTIAIMFALLLFLIFKERNQKVNGKWIFPAHLAIYIIVNFIMLYQIQFPLLDPIANWFVRLPIT